MMDKKDEVKENIEAAENEESFEAEGNSADNVEEKKESAAENEAGENLDELQMELSREELIEEVKEKKKKINEMDAEIDDLLQRLQRLQADFVNYRKRSQKEKADMTTQGKVELCAGLLPVIDNFERALKAEDGDSDFYKGVEMIYNQLLKVFADQGIEEILAEGEEFNPEFHEAIMRVEADEEEEGTVVDVMQKGFAIDGRVIRPAMVKVAV